MVDSDLFNAAFNEDKHLPLTYGIAYDDSTNTLTLSHNGTLTWDEVQKALGDYRDKCVLLCLDCTLGDNCFMLFSLYKKLQVVWCTQNFSSRLVTRMGYMFDDCYALQYVDASDWDISNVEFLNNMFVNCWSLKSVDVSKWDVSNVKDISAMFSDCNSLQFVDVSNWNVSNVTRMGSLFYGCKSLKLVDVSKWDTSTVINMSEMFCGCENLCLLDVVNWDVSNVKDFYLCFKDCKSVKEWDVSKWNVKQGSLVLNMFLNSSIKVIPKWYEGQEDTDTIL